MSIAHSSSLMHVLLIWGLIFPFRNVFPHPEQVNFQSWVDLGKWVTWESSPYFMETSKPFEGVSRWVLICPSSLRGAWETEESSIPVEI